MKTNLICAILLFSSAAHSTTWICKTEPTSPRRLAIEFKAEPFYMSAFFETVSGYKEIDSECAPAGKGFSCSLTFRSESFPLQVVSTGTDTKEAYSMEVGGKSYSCYGIDDAAP